MLWGVVRQFANDGTKKFVAMAFGLTVIGLILGMTDFKVLVNSIYPLSGYLGAIMFGFVMYRDYQRKHPKEVLAEESYEGSNVIPLRKIS